MAVGLALLGLMVNGGMMLVLPFALPNMRLNPNNAFLIIAIHLVTVSVILIISKVQVVSATDDATSTRWRRIIINADFVKNLRSSNDLLSVRYIEYSLTAGLFLVTLSLALYPNSDVWLLQVMYQGMMLCNLVGVAWNEVANAFCTATSENGSESIDWHGQIVLVMLLLSSWMFFWASFAPFAHTVMPLLAMQGIPQQVSIALNATCGVFVAFGVAGTVFMLWRMLIQAEHTTSGNVHWWALVWFEALNLGKFIIAAMVVASVVMQMGLTF